MKNEKFAFENFWHLPVYCLWNRKLLNVILILKFFWVTPSLDHLGSILYHSAPILKSGYIGQEICYSKILTADWTSETTNTNTGTWTNAGAGNATGIIDGTGVGSRVVAADSIWCNGAVQASVDT